MGKVVGKGGCDDAMAEEMLNCASPDRIVQRIFWRQAQDQGCGEEDITCASANNVQRAGSVPLFWHDEHPRVWRVETSVVLVDQVADAWWDGWPPASDMRLPDVEPRRCRRTIRWQRAAA